MVTNAKRQNAEIKLRLRTLFSPPEYAIFFEVAVGTGYDGQRRKADAVVMDMWPSRGMKITGFEIKVSRHDWLREKGNPVKAEAIAAYCDRWALVTASGVAKPIEVPHAWDWYELSDGGDALKLLQRGHETAAKALDRSFVASLLRCAARGELLETEAAAERMVEKARGRIEDEIKHRVAAKTHEAAVLLQRYGPIEEALRGGVKLHKFSSDKEMAEAVRIVLTSGVAGTYAGMASLSERLTSMAADIDKALKSRKHHDEPTESA